MKLYIKLVCNIHKKKLDFINRELYFFYLFLEKKSHNEYSLPKKNKKKS